MDEVGDLSYSRFVCIYSFTYYLKTVPTVPSKVFSVTYRGNGLSESKTDRSHRSSMETLRERSHWDLSDRSLHKLLIIQGLIR